MDYGFWTINYDKSSPLDFHLFTQLPFGYGCNFLFSSHNTTIHFFRHVLASLHFNENVNRHTQLSKDGEKYYKVTYPKFKLGEEVVREVASPPTYGKNVPVCYKVLLCNMLCDLRKQQ